MKDIQKLVFASPCVEFMQAIRTASRQEKDEMRALAKFKAESLRNYFIEKLHYGDGPKAGVYAHDLAERALLLSEDPADFASVAEVLDSTCALLPHVPTDRFKEFDLPLPICGVAGLASEMFRPLYRKYTPIRSRRSKEDIGGYLFYAAICLVLAGLVLLHPASVSFFAGQWLYKALVGLGALLTVIMIFVAGFVGAIVFMVAYAGVMSFLDGLLPLGLLVRIILALIPAVGSGVLVANFRKGRQRQAAYKKAKAAGADLLEDAEDALRYFELCLTRLEAYHKWREDHDVVEYPKAEKALEYYKSARDWASKFVRAFR